MPRTVPSTEWSFVGSFPAQPTRRGRGRARGLVGSLVFHAWCGGTGAVGCGHLPACLGIAGGGTFRGVGSGRSGGVGVVSRVFVFAGSVPWPRTVNTASLWRKIQIKWRRPLSKCKETVRKGDFMSAGKKGPF